MNSKPIFRPFRARSAKARSLGSRWERLESRELLCIAYPMFAVGHLVQDASPASASYTRAAVGLDDGLLSCLGALKRTTWSGGFASITA
jgi:hypothetical protein